MVFYRPSLFNHDLNLSGFCKRFIFCLKFSCIHLYILLTFGSVIFTLYILVLVDQRVITGRGYFAKMKLKKISMAAPICLFWTLSPYLFVIGMEVLSGLLKRAVGGNFISGYKVGVRDGGELVISHLLYADDTIIFCEANSEQLMYLRWTLMWFEAFSGLKINLNKV